MTGVACPACAGREPGLFESLCQRHFDELPGRNSSRIRAAMERGAPEGAVVAQFVGTGAQASLLPAQMDLPSPHGIDWSAAGSRVGGL